MDIEQAILGAGLSSQEDIAEVMSSEKKNGKSLPDSLIEMGSLTKSDFLTKVSKHLNLGYVDLKKEQISTDVLEKVPVKFVWHYKVVPVKFQNGVLTLALADPMNTWLLDDIKMNLNYELELVLALASDIDEAIHQYYGVGADTIDKILAKEEEKKSQDSFGATRQVEDIEKLAGDASVIKLVNQILKEAIENRATDIHFEMYEDELVVRYRVDGVLQEAKVQDDIKFLYSAIVARIKIMTGLDIVERRLPQSGGAHIRLGSQEYDLRVSVIPDHYGEGVVIRILPSEMLIELRDLGLSKNELENFKSLVERSHGLIYVTGPTGSGKTTTLYAALRHLNQPNLKIITVEDPVEYKLKYIEQIQVNAKSGLTFSQVLRSVLRHDPDVVMVGEVRDRETAEIAVQASLTGHLVLSTLHTNNAASGVTRLLDMKVEPFLISSTVLGILAQRLVRKVCQNCKEKVKWEPSSLPKNMQTESLKSISEVCRGKGCKKCKDLGYAGRLAIYEILVLTDEIRQMVLDRASASEIQKVASKAGMKTLLDSGWEKVKLGLTTPEEVLRVVQNQL